MAIPEFDQHGLLPPGLYSCDLGDLQRRFGAFCQTDRRPHLFSRLLEFVTALRNSSLFAALVVDGSFVTAKPSPHDIDLIAVLRLGHDFERDLPISEYSLVSRTLFRRRFGFDVLLAEQESSVYNMYLEFFSRVREAPELRKGLLRLSL